MRVDILPALRDPILLVIIDALDEGRIEMYGGAMPAPGATAGALQVTIALGPDPAVENEGAAILVGGQVGVRVADGAITWARLFDRDGVPIIDMDVAPSGAVLSISDPEGVIGGTVTLNPSSVAVA